MTDEGLQKQLDTKLFDFLRAIRTVVPIMRDKKWGRIVSMIGGAAQLVAEHIDECDHRNRFLTIWTR